MNNTITYIGVSLTGLLSLVFGVFGLLWKRGWSIWLGSLLGLGFSVATGFTIGYYVLAWPVLLLGQGIVLGRSANVRGWVSVLSVAVWATVLIAVGVRL